MMADEMAAMPLAVAQPPAAPSSAAMRSTHTSIVGLLWRVYM